VGCKYPSSGRRFIALRARFLSALAGLYPITVTISTQYTNTLLCRTYSGLKTVQQPLVSTDFGKRKEFLTTRVLGVILNNRLTATDRVDQLLSCSTLLYALRVLRSHGVPSTSLHDVFRSTVVAKITHCAPAWAGLVFVQHRLW